MSKFVAPAGALRQLDDGTVVVEGGEQAVTALELNEDDGTWRSSGEPGEPGGNDAAPSPHRRRTPRSKR